MTSALASQAVQARQAAAQVLAKIAAIELPNGQWPELIDVLTANVTAQPNDLLKQSTLEALGYICEEIVRRDAHARTRRAPASACGARPPARPPARAHPRLRPAALRAPLRLVSAQEPSVLTAKSNQILTAVVQGMRKEEANSEVRRAATIALNNALESVRANFENEAERNYIMQTVCEACVAEAPAVRIAAYECVVKVASLYYSSLAPYMQALFQLTFGEIKGGTDAVALQAVEFWSTVCDEEIALHEEAEDARDSGESPDLTSHDFVKGAMPYLVPLLLQTLTKQEEDSEEDAWNPAMAAGTCLALVAQAVGDDVVSHVMEFVKQHIQSPGAARARGVAQRRSATAVLAARESAACPQPARARPLRVRPPCRLSRAHALRLGPSSLLACADWRFREASTLAFGSVLEGPSKATLAPLVEQAIPIMVQLMADSTVHVRDTAAWTLGRICDLHASTLARPVPGQSTSYMHELVKPGGVLLEALRDEPRVAGNVCWALHNLAEGMDVPEGAQSSPLSAYFLHLVRQAQTQAGRQAGGRCVGGEGAHCCGGCRAAAARLRWRSCLLALLPLPPR